MLVMAVEWEIWLLTLLQELERTAQEGTVHEARNIGWLTGETLSPCSLTRLSLLCDRLLHLLEVVVDQFVVRVVLFAAEAG